MKVFERNQRSIALRVLYISRLSDLELNNLGKHINLQMNELAEENGFPKISMTRLWIEALLIVR